MLKKSFFGLSKPRFYYKSLSASNPKPVNISNSENITLYLKESILKRSPKGVQIGDLVKTGQKIFLSDKSSTYAISSVTGTVKSISAVTSNYGASHTAISITSSAHDELDETFKKVSTTPSLEIMANFLTTSPGEPPIWRLLDETKPVETILIYGGDTDLLLHNSLSIMTDNFNTINAGIKLLRNATGLENIVLVVPEDTIQNYSGHLDATIRTVSSRYPYAQPLMMAYEMSENIPAPKSINDDIGICFFKSEAVSSIGYAFKNNMVPTKKNVTIIDTNKQKHLVNVRIGTHISHILQTLKIKINDGDKIIFGGPMTGSAIFSENHPILPDTDLILIQAKKSISYYSNYPCTNCGECVRICPTNVPVNLLIRFLEAGNYEESADSYDLYSCVECGLCSYVCVSKIPVFQHIKLAKYELGRTGYAEEMNE